MQWEYCIIDKEGEILGSRDLNAYGVERWELAAVDGDHMIFKRPVVEYQTVDLSRDALGEWLSKTET